jgi:hypothetical protein
MLALVVLVLAALTVTKAPQGKELLRNGGFESGTEGWRTLDMSKGASFEIDTKVKHSGKQSLRFARSGAGAADFLKASVDLPARKGKLAVSIAYQVAKDSRVSIAAYFFDAQGDTIGKGNMPLADARTTKAFEVAKAELEIPEKATGFGINVILDKAGTVWIDSASVTLAAEPKSAARKKSGGNLLENGTFDEDVDGWMEIALGSGTTTASRDGAVKAGGAGALKLLRTGPRLFPEDGVQAIVPDPGNAKSFKLAFKARVDGCEAAVAAQAFDERGVALATSRATIASAAFAPGSLSLSLPAACDRVVVSFVVRGAGSAWLDDVVLEGK